MPLRDHFRPPVSKVASWEALHGQWPAVIVQQLKKQLPAGFVSEPQISCDPCIILEASSSEDRIANWQPLPDVSIATELPDYDEYEVRVYDATRERTLVAAIELVSPANKDRPEKRNALVGKCAALLQKGVAVSIVDVVTTRHYNLYAELLAFLGLPDSTFGTEPPPVYAASCRWVRVEKRAVLQTWPRVLAVGQPLPVLPLWLTATRVVPLDLEQSYEKTCDDLSIV